MSGREVTNYDERFNMRRVFLYTLLTAVVVTVPQRLRADEMTIDVLSQTYSVSVDFLKRTVEPGQSYFFNRSSSGSSPIYLTDLVSPSDPPLTTSPSPYTGAFGSVNGASAGFSAVLADYYGECSAQMTFRPSELAILTITCGGERLPESGFRIELQDLTAGITLLSRDTGDYERGHTEGIPWQGPYDFTVDPSHVYLLRDFAIGFTDRASAFSDITLRSIPDSSSTRMLLAFGLVGLAGLGFKVRYAT
jgi:hypothetical protein